MSHHMSIVFEGMNTPSRDPIPVASWKHDFSQARTVVGPNADVLEPAEHGNFQFTKSIDASSTKILSCCWASDAIKEVIFSIYHDDKYGEKIKYLEVKMENVFVSNVTVGGGPSSASEETVSLCYGIVTYKFIPPNIGDGGEEKPFSVSHDLKKRMIVG
jgi:type VI secretion system secreted protein Hcp